MDKTCGKDTDMRLIIISNRLPLTITRDGSTFQYKETSGGLVTGLKAVKSSMPFLWIGNISGMDLNDTERKTIKQDCWDKYKSVPVFIDAQLNEASYNGFCNGILWPTLHTFPDDVAYNERLFARYIEFNETFCREIAAIVEDNDIVWVHDYHLMLLPGMLRAAVPDRKISIGFFLHTPFPPADIFGTLPRASDIVGGILGADHIGFHTYDYLAHFIDTVRSLSPQILSVPAEPQDLAQQSAEHPRNQDLNPNHADLKLKSHKNSQLPDNTPTLEIKGLELTLNSRRINTKAISIGIDPDLFRKTLATDQAKARIEHYKEKFKGKKIILGVDRTDYIKGIPNRIIGFKKFLQKRKNLDVVFLQICVPSRLDVHEYASLIARINELSADLNASIGCVDETFMHVVTQSVQFDDLCALYAVADVCCISSLMDGMNLVAMEFVACQDSKNSVLMLSEFAGCASTLPGSVLFNPWNTDQIADTFESALVMSSDEKKERHTINKHNVDTFTAVKWAQDNVDCLKMIK